MMVVDFEAKRSPAYLVASLTRIGRYSGQNMMRREFTQLVKWAKKNKIRTGRWIFYEHESPSSSKPENKWRFEACLEIKRKAKPQGKIRIKKLPSQMVASVRFDPNKISPRLVYHGLMDWVRWRIRDKEFRGAGPAREVYTGNPWKDSRAWANTEVQILLRK